MQSFKEFISAQGNQDLEEAGLSHITGKKGGSIKTDITVPVKADVIINTYTDDDTGEVSQAKQYTINYSNVPEIQKAIARQIIDALKKQVASDDEIPTSTDSRGNRLIGFISTIPNKAMLQS